MFQGFLFENKGSPNFIEKQIMTLVATLLHELQEAKNTRVVNKDILCKKHSGGQNEFLFILKPEVFARTSSEQTEHIMNVVLDRISRYGLTINNVRVINAAYLENYNVIASHYGVINAAARDFNASVTDEIRSNFRNHYSIDLSESKVFGALELADKLPEITVEMLQKLWSTCVIKRLAGGIYSGEVDFKDEELYIINGFHPPQIEHFIANDRMIVTMNLSGELDWAKARQEFIGNTYPEKAEKGSLRRDIFDLYGKLGFDDASYVINSLHLSAGPLEALIELQRFNSDFQNNLTSPISNFDFGRLLETHFSKADCDKILTNPIVTFQDKQISLFDLTEELNSAEALDLILKVIR